MHFNKNKLTVAILCAVSSSIYANQPTNQHHWIWLRSSQIQAQKPLRMSLL